MGLPPTLGVSTSQEGTSIPVTTPPFVPTPGQGGGLPGSGDPTGALNDQTKKILQAIASAATRKQAANTAVPMALPQGGDAAAARQIGMNTANPHAWAPERFMHGVAANIKTYVAKQKQDQLLRAEGDWTYLQSALNEKFAAEQSGDPAAIQAAETKLQSILGDPKKLKNMAKALNQDWLNPEKTTVYGEALKNVAKQGQQKAGAMSGLQNLFKKIIGQNQQMKVQLDEQQKQQMAREIEAKAPITQGATTPADLAKEAEAVANLAYAQKQLKDAPEKYEFKAIKDETGGGEKLVAFDKSDPNKPYIEVKSSSGETAKKGEKQFAGEGKLEVVAGIPTGRVMHGGKYVAPGQSGYTDKDKEAVGLGMNAQGLSEKQKEKLAAIRGSSYAQERARYSVVPVVDNETSEAGYASPLEILRNPGKYVQTGEAEKISARESAHKSITANFDALDKDLDKLPNGLDASTQATLLAAFKSENENPGIIATLLVNKVKQGAPDEVIKYLTDMKAMQEDILVLRNVGGMGQGSDLMRQKMIHLIPGPASSSVKEAKMQMEAARRTSDSLFAGRPKAKFTDKSGAHSDKDKDPLGIL